MDDNEDPPLANWRVLIDGLVRVVISAEWDDPTHYDLLVTGGQAATSTRVEYLETSSEFRTAVTLKPVNAPQVIIRT